ncbi:hypothetical protein CROQUDRAFT_671068 [Cronartium quercuum f. sp. fusiforme G11]|uniref:FAR-17a/AIG1-like protein n=1 Tax=Cronartium quercuum f. sp. fusiforme G11 TaxID=708437 RepID=A0A9P6NGL9_9BASI|nr:hypothetical protein CROQUDRAFT_671068 [Cronartium quercuum f. sp. fusiforme G11]
MVFESPKGALLAFGFHLASFLNLSYSVWQIYQPGPMSSVFSTMFGGRSNFLTLWGLALSWITFALKLMLQLKPPIQSQLHKLHGILSLIALPVESCITLLYWSAIAIDPSLMIPPPPAVAPPLALDLALHVYPTLMLWFDHLFFAPTLKASQPTLVLALFALAYTSWVELISTYGNNNQFPYPFLTMASRPIRYIIYTSSLILSRAFHAIACSAHRGRQTT